MKKTKRIVHVTAESENVLSDIESRVSQFMAINAKYLASQAWNETLTINRPMVEGQQTAFASILALLHQIRKNGAIWRGGYLDNVGVVYEDQLAAMLDDQTSHLQDILQ